MNIPFHSCCFSSVTTNSGPRFRPVHPVCILLLTFLVHRPLLWIVEPNLYTFTTSPRCYVCISHFTRMYCVYLLLTFFYFSSLQSIPPLFQAFFELLPALITHHSAIYKHQSSQKHLLKVMCQPVHPCRNPTPTLKPSISLAALIHVLHHPQIPLPLLTCTCSTTIPLLAPCHMLSLDPHKQSNSF